MTMRMGMGMSAPAKGGGEGWPLNLFAGAKGDAIIPARFATDMWIDSAGVTPVAANGDRVGRIVGPNGHTLVQTGAATVKWTYGTSGGLHWIDADGVDDWIESASAFDFGGSAKATVFAAWKQNTGVTGALFETGASPTSIPGSMRKGATTPSFTGGRFYAGLHGSGDATAAYNEVAVPASRITTVIYDFAGATLDEELVVSVGGATPSRDVVSAGPAGAGPIANQKLYFGRRGGATLPANVRLWGLIWTTKDLTTAEISDTRARISALSGIAI